MDTGMLWCDPDPKKSLLDKVNHAAAYYFAKYGQRPNAAYVHPSAVAGDAPLERAGSVIVRPDRKVIKGHMWLGVEPQASRPPATDSAALGVHAPSEPGQGSCNERE